MQKTTLIRKSDGTPIWSNPRGEGQDYYSQMLQIVENREEFDPNSFVAKAMTAGTAGSGAEMIPESWQADIIWQIYENNWARQLFPTKVVGPGYKTNIAKFSTKLVEASGVSSPIDALPSELTSTTAIAKATMTTTEVELELKTFSSSLEVQEKFLAYNVDPSIEADLREEFASAMKEMEEDVIINGDTETTDSSNINYTYNSSSNKHGVNTADGNNQHLLLFDGLRIQATATVVTNAGAAWAMADFREMIRNQGVYARKGAENSTFIVSPEIYAVTLLGATELEFQKTKVGSPIVTGEVGAVYKRRVIVTDKMPCAERGTLTAASGSREASANSYTEMLLVYNKSVMIGVPSNAKRTFSLKKKEEIDFDRGVLVGIEDFGFAIADTASIVRAYYGTA